MTVTLSPDLAKLLHEAGGRWPDADEDNLHDLAKSWRTMGEKLRGLRADGSALARSVTETHHGQSIEAFSLRWSKVDAQLGMGVLAAEQTAVAVDGLAHATLNTKAAIVGVLAAGHAKRETINQASPALVGPLLRGLLPILKRHIGSILEGARRVIMSVVTPLLKAISWVFRKIGDFFKNIFGGKRPPKPPPKPVYRRDEPLPHARELIRNGKEWTATGRGGGKTPRIAEPNQVLYRRDPQTGNVRTYSVYDESGYIIKRVDLEGKPHGGVSTPHTQYYRVNTNPKTGQVRIDEPRAPIGSLPKEIP